MTSSTSVRLVPLSLSKESSIGNREENHDASESQILRSNANFDALDPALLGLTLYEKKSLLISRELDMMGMGKYQYYIWSLCGLGFFLDLLWAQAFGLIATPLMQELGFSKSQLGNIFTAFHAGLCAGAFVWGVLVDIIGRRWAFNGTVLTTCIFGLCLGIPDTYNSILVLTAFNGFGIGGNIPIDTTICLEFLPHNRRFLLALLSIFQPLGVVVCSGIAYAFIPKRSCKINLPSCYDLTLTPETACCSKADNYGWRYLMFTLGGITLFIFVLRFAVFTFQESPNYLLGKGRDKEALEVLHKVAKMNKRECNITLETFAALSSTSNESPSPLSNHSQEPFLELPRESILEDAGFIQKAKFELARVKILFSTPKLARLTILVWVIYGFDYWGFSIAGSFLPTILLKKNSAIKVSLEQTYWDYVIIYLPGIVGVALGALMVYAHHIGRRLALLSSSFLMGLSLLLFALINTHASNIGLNAAEYFFQSMFNAVLYGWTPEAFPAQVRGTASGVASFWGRLFSIFSPLVAARMLEGSLDGPLYVAGAGVWVCTFAILWLPRGSLGGGRV